MEKTRNTKINKSRISKPLFAQSVKANWVLWLILTIGSAAIFIIINLVVGSKPIFTNINMGLVMEYVEEENLQWLQILGLLERMGFSLSRIQVMSQIDMNSVLNDLVYKIAGVLLPMIYVMIVCNRLIASQVNDGSMAYVLCTPTNRKTVVKTQFVFMLISLIAMYALIFIGAYSSGTIAFFISGQKINTFGMFTLRTLIYCFGSFCAMFALTGVCFGASAYFNKSQNSIAVGGGACVLCFLCCILGLFGSKVFVSVGVGVEAMSVFNYMTLYTLIDTTSMSTFAKCVYGFDSWSIDAYKWMYELAILVAVGGILSLLGSIKFVKKDLPL